MKRGVVAFLAAAVTMPFALGDGSGCSGLDDGVLTGDCTITGVVEIAGSLSVPAGKSLFLQDGAVLRFTDAESPSELVVAGTLHLQDSTIEAVDGADLTIRFPVGSVGTLHDAVLDGYKVLESASSLDIEGTSFTALGTALATTTDVVVQNSVLTAPVALAAGGRVLVRSEDTTLAGAIDLAGTARLEVYWSVRVIAELDVAGPATLTVRDVNDDVFYTATGLGDGDEEVLPLLVQIQKGEASERFDPYRFILKSGLAADHVDVEIGAAQQDILLVLDDDDNDAPTWTTDNPLELDGPVPGRSHDGTVVLAWEAADDTLGGERPNRAVSHYRVLRDGEEHLDRTRATTGTIEDLPEGVYRFIVQAVDLVGNVNTSPHLTIDVDRTPPTVAFALDAAGGGIDVTVTATDPGDFPSGVAFLRWRIGEGPTTIVPGEGSVEVQDTVRLQGPGNHSLVVITADRAGHRVEEVQAIVIDTSSPSFLARLEPRLPVGGWHRDAPELHVDVLDPGPSGPGDIEYRIGDGDWQAYDNSTVLDAPGEHRVQVRVWDGANNSALTQLRVAYDPDAPTMDAGLAGPEGRGDWFLGPVQVTASGADTLSGLDRLEYRIAQGTWRPLGTVRLDSSGEHQFTLRATDGAGNQAVSALVVPIDMEAPTAPVVTWLAKDGRVQGDWSRTPPADGVSGIAEIVVERDGSGTTLGAEAKGHTVALPNGDHRLRVRVLDHAGNEAASPWATVTVANSTVEADKARKVRGEVSLGPTPVEGMVEARFFVDGILLDAAATEPYTVTWQTRMLSDGVHEVRIVTVDSDGLHHEELRAYNVRNGYAAVLVDEAVPAGLALLVSTGAVVVASVGFVRWRRWTL